jgi:hypothetical protein
VERRREQREEEQEGKCSQIPHDEEELEQDADEAEEELRVPLHQTLPDGCCCCALPPKTTILAAKYTSTPRCGDRPESDPALRDTPDTLTLPSPSTSKVACACCGGFFVTAGRAVEAREVEQDVT